MIRHMAIPMLLALGVMSLALTGCRTAAPGVTSAAGTYETQFHGSPEKVTEAAKAVLEEMHLTKVNSKWTNIDGLVTGETAQGTEVQVKVNRKDDKVSAVAVRVGYLGDKDMSLSILEKIKAKL